MIDRPDWSTTTEQPGTALVQAASAEPTFTAEDLALVNAPAAAPNAAAIGDLSHAQDVEHGAGVRTEMTAAHAAHQLRLLTASEVGELKVDADQVVLSACNAAAVGGAFSRRGVATVFTRKHPEAR